MPEGKGVTVLSDIPGHPPDAPAAMYRAHQQLSTHQDRSSDSGSELMSVLKALASAEATTMAL